MKIEKLNELKSKIELEIECHAQGIISSRERLIKAGRLNEEKILIADFRIALQMIENLLNDMFTVKSTCERALSGDKEGYYNFSKFEKTFDHYAAIESIIGDIKLPEEVRMAYNVVSESKRRFVTTPSSFEIQPAQQVEWYDNFIIDNITNELFLESFNEDINKAIALAESRGSIEEILSLIS